MPRAPESGILRQLGDAPEASSRCPRRSRHGDPRSPRRAEDDEARACASLGSSRAADGADAAAAGRRDQFGSARPRMTRPATTRRSARLRRDSAAMDPNGPDGPGRIASPLAHMRAARARRSQTTGQLPRHGRTVPATRAHEPASRREAPRSLDQRAIEAARGCATTAARRSWKGALYARDGAAYSIDRFAARQPAPRCPRRSALRTCGLLGDAVTRRSWRWTPCRLAPAAPREGTSSRGAPIVELASGPGFGCHSRSHSQWRPALAAALVQARRRHRTPERCIGRSARDVHDGCAAPLEASQAGANHRVRRRSAA